MHVHPGYHNYKTNKPKQKHPAAGHGVRFILKPSRKGLSMSAPTREDATLMIQIAQWMATPGIPDQLQT